MKKIKFIPVITLFVVLLFGFTTSQITKSSTAEKMDLPSFQIVVKDQYGTTPVPGCTITVKNSSGVKVGNQPITNSSGIAYHDLGGASYPYDTYTITSTQPPSYGPSFIYYVINSANLQTQYINMGAPLE